MDILSSHLGFDGKSYSIPISGGLCTNITFRSLLMDFTLFSNLFWHHQTYRIFGEHQSFSSLMPNMMLWQVDLVHYLDLVKRIEKFMLCLCPKVYVICMSCIVIIYFNFFKTNVQYSCCQGKLTFFPSTITLARKHYINRRKMC